MRQLLLLLLLAAVHAADPFAAPAGGWPAAPATGHQKATVDLDGQTGSYLLSVPKDYSADKAWPLWIVLHGSNGRPDDLASVFRSGLVARGAIAVFPQALDRKVLEWNYPDEGAYLLALIHAVGSRYRLDPQRLYLGGHSMGGGGTWAMGAVLSDLWAGVFPLSGWYAATPRPRLDWLGAVPAYIIHGDQDPNVTVQNSRMATKELARLGRSVKTLTVRPEAKDLEGADVIYRELPGVGHDIFNPWKTLGAEEIGRLVAWLSTKSRAKPADPAAAQRRLADWGRQFAWSPEGGRLGTYRK